MSDVITSSLWKKKRKKKKGEKKIRQCTSILLNEKRKLRVFGALGIINAPRSVMRMRASQAGFHRRELQSRAVKRPSSPAGWLAKLYGGTRRWASRRPRWWGTKDSHEVRVRWCYRCGEETGVGSAGMRPRRGRAAETTGPECSWTQ